MTQVKVLYQRTPMWRVGEDRPACKTADLAARLDEFAALGAAERYPNDYCGRVISVAPLWAEFSPADLADPRRAVVQVDDESGLRSKRVKIIRKETAEVTFDDRLGAVAGELAKTWENPELEEKFAAAEVADAEDENTTRDADQERALAEWRETVAECAALGSVLDTPPPRHPGHVPVPDNRFDVEASRLAKLLPKTVTHTGAGLYKVQAAGTMPTPAHLWAMDAVDPPDIGDPGGNPGTGSNVTVVGGQIGSALDFNGNNSHVNVGDVTELNAVQKFTMACRIYENVLDTSQYILEKFYDASSNIYCNIANNGNMYFRIFNGVGGQGYFDYSSVIGPASWHHVTMVFDGTQTGDANRLVVYVDGEPVILTFIQAIPASTADLSGVDATISRPAHSAFNGKLDDFRIYADALTDAQVKVLAGRGLAHWDTIGAFNENLLLHSEGIASSPWTSTNSPVIVSDTDIAPNGQRAADTIADESITTRDGRYQDGTVPNDANWVRASVYVKKDSDTSRFPEFRLTLQDGVSQYIWLQLNTATGATTVRGSLGTVNGNVTDAGTYWRVEFDVQNNASGNVTARAHIFPAHGTTWGGTEVAAVGSIVVWGAQVSLLTLQTYKPTRSATDTSVTLTTGGLTDGERDGEVFVSGGNAYAVVRNGTDSVLVVGNATGESGTCSISPYSTFQSGADQLWGDQGAATFTSSQYIRGFAGTYDENLDPNGGLDPNNSYALVIEGDPNDDRDNIVIAPSTGTWAVRATGSTAYGILRHLRVIPVSGFAFYTAYPAIYWRVLDCYLGGPVAPHTGWAVEDCYVLGYMRYPPTLRRSTFVGPGKGSGYALYGRPRFIDSCVFYGWESINAIFATGGRCVMHNCTLIASSYGICLGYSIATDDDFSVINCIFDDVDYPVHWAYPVVWPEETPTRIGPRFTLLHNCYYGYTAFAREEIGPSTKTYAEFVAFNRVYSEGDLDATDPLLTNPAGGDFSLQAASPCRGVGHGSCIVAYVDGTAADANHPNIGAEGTAADPPAPVWAAGLSNLTATDQRVGDEIALAWGAASIGGAGLSIEYGVQRRIGAGAWTTVWIGSGTSTNVCENTTGQLYEFRVVARCADYEQAWIAPTDSASATARAPVPPTVSDWTVSGTMVTVTLVGVAGRTYRVRLMDGAGGEDDEQGRTGSGDVTLTAGGYGARYFTAWEVSDGVQSEPTGVYAVTIDDPADADVAYYRVVTVTGLPSAPHKTATLERIKRPIQP